jgi:type II secretory pathway pseudopilin PulG
VFEQPFISGVFLSPAAVRPRVGVRAGFTLVELLVATLLMIILASLSLMILPALNQGQQTTQAASQLQQWIEVAKQRAAKDRAPRGIRLLFDPPAVPGQFRVSRLEYIEQPDPYTLHGTIAVNGPMNGMVNPSVANTTAAINGVVTFGKVIFAPSSPQKTLTGGYNPTDPTKSQLWPVQPGDCLELAGVVYKISNVTGLYSLQLSPPYPPIAVATTNYRILRQPRPLGDDIMQMEQNIVIDITPRNIGGAPGHLDLPIVMPPPPATTPVPLDIMFAPDGRMIPTIGSAPNLASYDRVILWVRDVTVPDGQGDPALVVVYPRTGLIAAHPVDIDPVTGALTSPYTFTTSGQRSSD